MAYSVVSDTGDKYFKYPFNAALLEILQNTPKLETLA